MSKVTIATCDGAHAANKDASFFRISFKLSDILELRVNPIINSNSALLDNQSQR